MRRTGQAPRRRSRLTSNVRPHNMHYDGPVSGVQTACERVLRTLPRWFGIEESLLEYASNTAHLPTMVAKDGETIIGFLSLQRHFQDSWEVNCIAVDLAYRGRGVGRELHRRAEAWLAQQGGRYIQVKTLAPAHPSREYAETRKFYEALGYTRLEVFGELWGPNLPVLQLVKSLPSAA